MGEKLCQAQVNANAVSTSWLNKQKRTITLLAVGLRLRYIGSFGVQSKKNKSQFVRDKRARRKNNNKNEITIAYVPSGSHSKSSIRICWVSSFISLAKYICLYMFVDLWTWTITTILLDAHLLSRKYCVCIIIFRFLFSRTVLLRQQ